MNRDFKKKLKKEVSENVSGTILNISKIPILKESNYCIIPFNLDGDAPKRFIKAYFYESGKVYKSKYETWNAYIAKSAQKWYPIESIIEYLLNQIGDSLGLKMNSTRLSRINGQIRFLSKYFLDSKNEKLVHGAEICGEYLEDSYLAQQIAEDRGSARELFTIEFIIEAINTVFKECCQDIIEALVEMIVFDAIVGNNDRHFYNWGVIKQIKTGEIKPKFSPIYDTARGLLWNWNDDLVKIQYQNLQTGGEKIEKYINKACPRISIDGNSNVNHFDLVHYIWLNFENYRGKISNLLSLNNENDVITLYNTDFKQYFIHERNELVRYILKERFQRLRKIIN